MKLVIAFVSLFSWFNVLAQKPALDTSVFNEWTKVRGGQISDDGKFISYEIVHFAHTGETGRDVVIRSVKGDWQRQFSKALSNVSFVPGGKKAMVTLSSDSVAIIHLGTDRVAYRTDIASYALIPGYMIYQSRLRPDSMIMESLQSGKKRYWNKIVSYEHHQQKGILLLRQQGADSGIILSAYFLKDGRTVEFWRGKEAGGFLFDNGSDRLAFLGSVGDRRSVWLYKMGDAECSRLIDLQDIDADRRISMDELVKFSPDGQKLFLKGELGAGGAGADGAAGARTSGAGAGSVGAGAGSASAGGGTAGAGAANADEPVSPTGANVAVWSYSDAALMPQLKRLRRAPAVIQYVINIGTKKVTRLTYANDLVIGTGNEFAIVQHNSGLGIEEEAAWNPQSRKEFFRVSFNGERTRFSKQWMDFSPSGRYIFYYDSSRKAHFIENTMTGKIVDVTKSFTDAGFFADAPRGLEPQEISYDNVSWLRGDSTLIVFTQRDIWQIDADGVQPAVCMTHRYGMKHDISLYPITLPGSNDLRPGTRLILMGFDYKTKDNGFYRMTVGREADPEKLVMDRYVYYMPREGIENGFDNQPVKAAHANVWLIKRMKASESPNYFTTTDFRNFQPVSDVYPEKGYNWMSTDLYTWQTPSGDSLQGILYKPEDFDARKRYPIIFHYYNGFSRNLHAYLDPAASIGPINIPWFVSHGYLVFVPDIKYVTGNFSQNVVDAVVSAAQRMSREPFVDSTKMGIQGHSFGGYETNCILTHTGIFAAANESSGVADIISFTGTLNGSGISNHVMANIGQLGVGASLWEDRQRYINNSPIFSLPSVTTPLLMMATPNDGAVPFAQAIELFTGLRQLRKKVWMLIYEGEDHILYERKNALDYTARQLQFFDVYLKGSAKPEWMREE